LADYLAVKPDAEDEPKRKPPRTRKRASRKVR
jgi:hypothetical protein